jgi:hypothetical protein
MLNCRKLDAQETIFCNSVDLKNAHSTRVTNKCHKFASPYHNYFGFWRHSEVAASKKRVEKTRITRPIAKFTPRKILLNFIDITSKGKAIPAEIWRGPCKDSHKHRPPLAPATHSCQRLCRVPGHDAAGMMILMKKSWTLRELNPRPSNF